MAGLEELEEEQFSLEIFLATDEEAEFGDPKWLVEREPRERKVTFDSVKQSGVSWTQDLVSGPSSEAFCNEKWEPLTTEDSALI